MQRSGHHFVFYVLIGFGLFAGYYGREDLTRGALCEFNGETCYKTGDLAWLNPTNRQLEFGTYRNHLIKLKSHSTELKEVESVLLEMVANCVVVMTKYKNMDYLVAYVQTTRTIQNLRQHCLARLPFYMVPSIFIILDTLITDQNEEVLPPPDFTCVTTLSDANRVPRTEIEQRVHRVWCQVLPDVVSVPSIFTSFFSLADDPESFVKLFCLYSTHFKHNLPITIFLKQSTIAEHARLLLENATLGATHPDGSQLVIIKEGE